jgi:uncharacterized protein (DUF2141 family)
VYALLTILGVAALPLHVLAADVRVAVSGVRNDRGRILVAICERTTFLQANCPWYGSAPATPGVVRVMVSGVPPGVYAAQAFHDEDANGKLERSFLGLPREGMGFSNDAPMHFGPPRFDAAAFPVGSGGADIRFSLRYY